ncbi:hypothetical protein U9M48_014611, partial [Paspalum notatum var. saurae]
WLTATWALRTVTQLLQQNGRQPRLIPPAPLRAAVPHNSDPIFRLCSPPPCFLALPVLFADLTPPGPASSMVLGSNISIEKTLYEVLSVSEDATYDEIRVAYKSAVLNTHPDKAQTHVESYVPSNEQQEFLGVQKAWEILRQPESRADYDKQLLLSRQTIEVIASEIEVGDMIIDSTANNTVELLYPCRCGDYFSIASNELGEMGISVSEEGEVEPQAGDSVLASVILDCGSCSLKVRLVIDKTS